MEVKIVQEVAPVIEINFEEMKSSLSDALKKYEGIVVTEQTLNGCKATQKELAGVRIKLDQYRKEKKKELSAPISAFEDQCKQLIALVESVEKPIKKGIEVFDEAKRQKKRDRAEELIKEVITENELNEKYGSRLTVTDKYCNLSAKDGEVKSDLTARAMALKVEQDREAELIEIIKDAIDTENKKLTAKMSFDDFERLVLNGMPTKEILANVKSRAEAIFKAEHPEPEPEVEEVEEVHFVYPDVNTAFHPIEEIPFTDPVEEIEEPQEELYYAVYRITGTAEDLKGVSQFLKQNGIAYSVQDQGEI